MFDYIKTDLARLSPTGKKSFRVLAAGFLSQGFQAILVYRFFSWLQRNGMPGQPLRFVCERFIEVTTGISIPARCVIGKGFRIHHFGGIVFHPTVVIGDNCTLYHGVTIGDSGGAGGAAKIGNNVLIGTGAKIIGEITINDNCLVGANAVVAKDMPADTVATGSPCRFKGRSDMNVQSDDARSKSVHIPRVMDLRGTYKGGGGPDKTILNSAAQHDPNKVHVLVTYIRQPADSEFQIPKMAARLGINYVDVPDAGTFDLNCLQKLKLLVREHRLTLVHAHDDKTLLYAWLLTLMTPGLKIMYTCHSHAVYGRDAFTCFKDYMKFKLRQRLQIVLMQRYHKPIITVSHDTRKRLLTNGLAEKDVAVLYNGIDLSYWQRQDGNRVLREELGIAENGFLVGTVARITYEKDLPTFYRVAEQVAVKFPEVVFVIVGDGNGDDLEKAKQDVVKRGLDRLVKFTGHRNDLIEVYESFDVFLMTSLTEGLPNTLLEAMALGVPSVSTAVGGVPELLIHEKCGYLAPVGAAEELADHITALLSDPGLLASCGKACRKRVEEHFSFAARVSAMEDYYVWNSGYGQLPENN